jgi:formylglycine-generating enzyme required for sulfatase activity
MQRLWKGGFMMRARKGGKQRLCGRCLAKTDGTSSVTEPKTYENFDLQIEKGLGRGFRVSVLSSPAGEDAAVFRPPYSDRELQEILEQFGTTHRDLGSAKPDVGKSAEQVGERLFDALFHDKVRHRWESSRSRVEAEGNGLRLRLRLREVPRFETWPWELLFDPSRRRFLSQSIKTPVVRYLGLPTAAPLLRAEPPLRMLVVIAEPAGYAALDGNREWERLRQALSGWEAKGWIVLERLGRATLEELQQKLLNPCHILHFIGHGRFDPGKKEGAIVLEDEAGQGRLVTGAKLGAILAAQSELRLVVLNACEGAQASMADPFSGLAQALVGCRIPAVIAMRSRITDQAAIAFAEHFYGALGRNQPVDAALADARRAMFSRRDDLEWITPVLYTRSPDGQLFNFPQEARQGRFGIRRLLGTRRWWILGLSALLLLSTAAVDFLARAYRSDPNTFYSLLNPPECPSPPGTRMAFVKIQPGTFLMGARPGKKVTLTQPFCIGRFEVTQGQWQTIMKRSTRRRQAGDALPVSNVSWLEIQDFLAQLNLLDSKARYRLPTEAQWEYAARAGTDTLFSFGDYKNDLSRYANCQSKEESDGYEGLAPVGSFQKNSWGLFDVHGNVAEWVADWFDVLSEEAAVDPAGPATGTEKVRRGGSFKMFVHCDSLYRTGSKLDRRNEDTGLRLVRDLKH